MEGAASPKTAAEKRNLLSSVFIGLLLALAYQEMVAPAREAFRAEGFSLDLLILLAVFFFTTMRFFIGAILHLVDDRLLALPGGHWFVDFLTISLEMTLIIFLGGLTSVEANRAARIDFFNLLTLLYAVDVVWIVGQWLVGWVRPGWKRPSIPWGWAWLNGALVLAMLATRFVLGNPFVGIAFVLMGAINLLGFVVDVILIDHYKVLRASPAESKKG